jgi:hypothetical protein
MILEVTRYNLRQPYFCFLIEKRTFFTFMMGKMVGREKERNFPIFMQCVHVQNRNV